MDSLPKRKQNRLTGYDYSQPGCYFVTICAKNRRYLFWDEFDWRVGADIIRPHTIPLSLYGRIIKNVIEQIPVRYPGASVEKYIIMPNHIHLLLRISVSNGRMISAPTYRVPTIIGQMKRAASKQAQTGLWQKGYHDHIIRSEADYLRIWDYIDTNPAKWREDCYYCQAERTILPGSAPACSVPAAPTTCSKSAPSSVTTSGRATFPQGKAYGPPQESPLRRNSYRGRQRRKPRRGF